MQLLLGDCRLNVSLSGLADETRNGCWAALFVSVEAGVPVGTKRVPSRRCRHLNSAVSKRGFSVS